MAGNAMLISPELLVQSGLLEDNDIEQSLPESVTKVNYSAAEQYKSRLMDKAYERWVATRSEDERKLYEDYCDREAYWLNDFALYSTLKEAHNQQPWYAWPEAFRKRDKQSLESFQVANSDAIAKIKWVQMTFDRQWQELKVYCNQLHIRLLGDVPIYVAYDSADVWSNRDIFLIDENGSLKEMAGVPPDLFNDDGQLWGMPIFDWSLLKSRQYDWWKDRFRKNFEHFDLLRLDHFRAFSSYWSVPAGSQTAKNGEWKQGPGKEFFDVIAGDLGRFPFVAEDLGEIDEPVYALRDELGLPGMNVLQFAFGDDMPESPYLPHHHIPNSVVYTGTHDNNTTIGWFKSLNEISKKHLSAYIGKKITPANVNEHLARLAYMSVAETAILPMQDVLSLDESARMNMPASVEGNWAWRLDGHLLNKSVENKLNEWCFYYDRMRK